MTKLDTLRELGACFPEANFVVNVVLCWHRNPSKKLKGMLVLLRAGHTVSVGANIDHLLIDGYSAEWVTLETPTFFADVKEMV